MEVQAERVHLAAVFDPQDEGEGELWVLLNLLATVVQKCAGEVQIWEVVHAASVEVDVLGRSSIGTIYHRDHGDLDGSITQLKAVAQCPVDGGMMDLFLPSIWFHSMTDDTPEAISASDPS